MNSQAIQLPSRSHADTIQAVVADSYGINRAHMRSAARDRYVARPRQIAMYLARKERGLSLTRIGQLYGGRDHTTVAYAVRMVEQRMKNDPIFRADVEALRKAVRV